ncbi:NfeD family protein [Amnibacterium kyonggiense]|uniref:Membrane protein implicated in regulation of membrane protease activity n=1 Tax=Amnibacterium kyonggiense TaxID=595671 RepID=A0A4R7FL20_9MICO|nr:NfeD family protein [Amnibacterium kyonggiense]TDS77066.1 membrane protein implicated in regulation of membrane protease activity [Amnibacterium kyonggiense]
MFPDLFAYTWVLWLVITVVAVVLELVTLSLVFAMIAVGSLVGGLGTWLLGWPAPLQVVAAAVLSALLVFLIRPVLYRALVAGKPRQLTNVDALHGMSARATASFVDGTGYARLANGETWTARLDAHHEHEPVAVGARLTVIGIDGATAVVAPALPPTPGTGATP